MNSSLEKLANNLRKSKGIDGFPILKSQFPTESPLDLLVRKGTFPYSWYDDMNKLSEKQLPSREKFLNDLKQEECTEEDNAHAQDVWKKFNCSNFQDYLNLYLKTDVLLL